MWCLLIVNAWVMCVLHKVALLLLCVLDSNIQFDTPISAALLAAQRAERVQSEKVNTDIKYV